jgi:hypothetical protein
MRFLLVALLVAGCYRDSTPSTTPPANKAHPSEQVTSDVLAFIPKDSDIVGGIDLARLRSSPLWANQIEPLMANNGGRTLTKIRTSCGFDPITAVSHFAFGVHQVDTTNELTAVARDIEPRGAIECVAKILKSPDIFTRDGDTLVIAEKGDTFQLALSPLGRAAVLAVGGPVANRALVTSRVQSGTPLRTSPAFVELYNKLEPNASVWFIANGASPLMQPVASAGIKPRFIDGTVTVTDRYVAVLRVTFATPDEAQNLATLSNSVSAQVRAMVETFDVHADGPVVRFDVVMTSAQAQTVLGMLGMAM